MTKQSKVIQGICCVVVFSFISGVIMPACSAQICTMQSNETEPLKFPSQDKMGQSNYDDDETFFNFAIIWGTFEHKFRVPFIALRANNSGPWYNQTMYVIGYQNWVPKWVFKTSYEIYCGFLYIGFVGFHRLCVIAWGNVAAFSKNK
jgi:hypothetical protein